MSMISEGSCDTEDWSNDAENSAVITDINYIFKLIKNKVLSQRDPKFTLSQTFT